MLLGNGILQYSADSFLSHCESVVCKRAFQVSRRPVVLLKYTLPSHVARVAMSLAKFPGQLFLTIGIKGQMLVFGHFRVHLFASEIQSEAYCEVPFLYKWDPEPNKMVVPGGSSVRSRISAAKSPSSLRVGFSVGRWQCSCPHPLTETVQSFGRKK
jgi:hypothetical protein